MNKDSLRRLMLQEDRLGQIKAIGSDPWFLAYAVQKSKTESSVFFSGLIANEAVEQSLASPYWDMQMGTGRPGIVTIYEDGQEQDYYARFGGLEGIEPLILVRQFSTPRPSVVEVIEEFRLYFNLYHDEKAAVFLGTDGVGNDEEIIRVTDGQIEIRLRELREFAALKGMHIVSFFDLCRYSPTPFSELDIELGDEDVSETLTRYLYSHRHLPLLFSKPPYLSSITGKKLIPGLSPQKLQKRISERPAYAPVEFIVGVDEDGEPIMEARPGQDSLRPVFFRREVLQKYYSNSDKYTVDDGMVSCSGVWHSQIDNNHPKYVIVHLGDLGTKIPEEELPYWKNFNVAPDGAFSEVHIRRAYCGEFTDPVLSDHVFKQRYQRFQRDWEAKMGWSLFKPLAEDDKHHFKTLRIPLTGDQKEFDEQVLSLAKVLIESINEKGITATGITVAERKQGISKLEECLRVGGMADYEKWIKYLRNLQDLRAGSAHRKSSKENNSYRKAAASFGLHEVSLSEAFSQILIQAVGLLEALRSAFLVEVFRTTTET
jgi:hypothetical protein